MTNNTLATLDDALDDLPRYYAVADQPKNGVLAFEAQPHMVTCVTVEDVREMLRRKLAGGFVMSSPQDPKPPNVPSSGHSEVGRMDTFERAEWDAMTDDERWSTHRTVREDRARWKLAADRLEYEAEQRRGAVDPSDELARVRALLKQAHARAIRLGEFPSIAWYDEVARYFKGQVPTTNRGAVQHEPVEESDEELIVDDR